MFGHKLERSGITYSQELEWSFAAQWAHYKVEEFEKLPSSKQAWVIAMYQARHQIDAVLAEHAKIEAKREEAARKAAQSLW